MGGRYQARAGELVDVLALPGFVVICDRAVGALVTYARTGDRAEVAAVVVAQEHRGTGLGGALIEAAAQECRADGVHTLWLVTTNDNLDALLLYQRHGFRLTDLRPGAVDGARGVKPQIPAVGAYGIPLRDELILSRTL